MSSSSRVSTTIKGLIVTKINFLIFGIYFLRDIILTRKVGINSNLDIVFAALIIPMFLANIISSPILNILTTSFCQLESTEEKSSLMIQALKKVFTFYIPIGLAGLIFINLFASNFLTSANEAYLSNYLGIFQYTIIVFLLSGPIAILNALLNSMGKAIHTTICGSFVPLTCILSIVSESFQFELPKLFIYSLLIGQVLNLIALIILLAKNDLLSFKSNHKTTIEWQQYFHLMIGGAFLYTITPIDQIMSANIMSGSISAVTLTHKIVNFVTSLSNNVLTSVLLPFFASTLINSKDKQKEDLIYFYRIGNVLTFLGAGVLILLAPNIVNIMIGSKNISQDQINLVTSLIRIGSLQIPFLFGFLIIQKYLTSQRKNYIVLIVSISIILLNSLLNYYLREIYGIHGITMATTISLYLGSCILMLLTVNENLIVKKSALKYFSGWTVAILFGALSI